MNIFKQINLKTHRANENSHWVEDYLKNAQKLNKSEHTLKSYRSDLNLFIGWYNHHYRKDLRKINSAIIGEYTGFLSGHSTVIKKTWWERIFKRNLAGPWTAKELSIATKRRHLSSLKNFFEYLKEIHQGQRNWFQDSPVRSKLHMIKLKDVDVEHTPLLKPQEWDRLMDKIYRLKDRVLLKLLYFGGLRIQELANLRRHHFDLQSGIVTLERKGGSIHHLKLYQFQFWKADIETYLSYLDEKGPLFLGPWGRALTVRSLYTKVKLLLMKAQCPKELSPHSFRKACASNLYQQTKDLLFVRDYLNHSDAKVTQTYIER